MMLRRLAALLISFAVGCSETPVPTPPPALPVEVAPTDTPKSDAQLGADDRPDLSSIPETPDEDAQETSPPAPKRPRSFSLPKPIEIPPRSVLAAARLNLVETKTVRIVTDLSDQELAPLLEKVDQIWPSLQATFGELPRGVPVDVIPITAFVVKDETSFIQTGLFRTLPKEIHGKHNGWQFWLRWPTTPYYQTHLFAHESAHCYSLITRPDLPAGWMESIAEWFATHSEDGGRLTFGSLPESSASVAGWGRIELLKQDLSRGRRLTAVEVASLPGEEFKGIPTVYAWAWALSTLMHAADPDSFQTLLERTTQGECTPAELLNVVRVLDESGLWQWWLEAIDYGIDAESALPIAVSNPGQLLAQAGWQGQSVLLKPGDRLRVRALGEVQLSDIGRPWLATADGIRADYAAGHPLGLLLGRTLVDGVWTPAQPIGANGVFVAPSGGELFLRVNDHWNDLSNNTGQYSITLESVD